MIKILYLIRGLPGSGKSTLALKLASKFNCPYYEADMYFINDSKYLFNAAALYHAHKWCMKNVFTHMQENESVIVSNTFTTYKEMKPYLKKAKSLYYRVVVIECSGQFENIHDVPEETIQRMKDRWYSTEDLMKFLDDENVTVIYHTTSSTVTEDLVHTAIC